MTEQEHFSGYVLYSLTTGDALKANSDPVLLTAWASKRVHEPWGLIPANLDDKPEASESKSTGSPGGQSLQPDSP